MATNWYCDGVRRRDFLRVGVFGATGLSLADDRLDLIGRVHVDDRLLAVAAKSEHDAIVTDGKAGQVGARRLILTTRRLWPGRQRTACTACGPAVAAVFASWTSFPTGHAHCLFDPLAHQRALRLL